MEIIFIAIGIVLTASCGVTARINYKTNRLRKNARAGTICSIYNEIGDRIPARVISVSFNSITLQTLDGIKTRGRKELYL